MTIQKATNAIAQWPIKVRKISLAAHRENAVYRVESEEGVFALRLHRLGYRSDDELNSEMEVMAALSRAGLSLPVPLQNRRGLFLAHCEGVQATVLTWLSGTPLGETGKILLIPNRTETFQALGNTIAAMHNALDAWTPSPAFKRVHWNIDGLLGDAPHWGRFWDHPNLSPEDKNLLLTLRELLRKQLSQGPWDYGYIHADLVSENLLVDGNAVSIIDFDDSGFGFRLHDIATALVKHQNEPDYQTLRAALIAGYTSKRPLDTASIDTFLLIRHLTYLGWIVPRMQSPGGPERAKRFIDQALPAARAYLVASQRKG